MKKTLFIPVVVFIFLSAIVFAQETSTYFIWIWKIILGLVVLGSLYVIWINLKPSSVHDTNDIVWVKKERNYLGIAVVVLVVVIGYLFVDLGLGSETTANAEVETVQAETIPLESQAVIETEQDTIGTPEETNNQDSSMIGGVSETESALDEIANETWDETVQQSDEEVIEKEKDEFKTNMTKKDVEKYMQDVQGYLKDVRRELSNATDIGKKTGEAIKLYGKTRELFNKATISLRNDELNDAVYYADETRKIGQDIRDLINEQD